MLSEPHVAPRWGAELDLAMGRSAAEGSGCGGVEPTWRGQRRGWAEAPLLGHTEGRQVDIGGDHGATEGTTNSEYQEKDVSRT